MISKPLKKKKKKKISFKIFLKSHIKNLNTDILEKLMKSIKISEK